MVRGLELRRICGIYCGGFAGVMLWVVVCAGYVEFASLIRCDAVSFGWRGRCASFVCCRGNVFLHIACGAFSGGAVG